MQIIADTHVHLYQCYDLQKTVETLIDNLGKHSDEALKAAILTERYDCHFFNDIKAGKVDLSGSDYKVSAHKDLLTFSKDGETVLYMFPGRQIVTKERIEILALGVSLDITDGLSTRDTVNEVLEAGGIPAIGWSPGKWFFGRGKIVQEIIEEFAPDKIVVSDTILRPGIWAEPILMKMARTKGVPVIAGTDSLPFHGEEKYMGTYATLMEGDIDIQDPVASLKRIILRADAKVLGQRCGLFEVLYRLRKNAKAKQNS